MYAIGRIEAKPGIWCWAVAFRRRGIAYYKSFYDVRRGGAKQALAAAVLWRDRKLKRTAVLTTLEFRQLRRSNNRSGAPGVLFIRSKNQPRGSWQAKLRIPGNQRIARTFAVQKHGNRRAYALALAARSELLELIDNRPYLHHPTAKKFAAQSATRKASRGSTARGAIGTL